MYSEKQIQVHVAPGITVDGRIDLIRRLDTDETSIVDFKSTERAQAEDVTRDQLHVYAVGYQELTGQRADLIEVLNLDEKGKTTRELVNDSLLTDIQDKIADRWRGPARQPAAPPSSLVLDVRGLRPGRPLQESPVIVIDRFIEVEGSRRRRWLTDYALRLSSAWRL